jgi:hypothetical protein
MSNKIDDLIAFAPAAIQQAMDAAEFSVTRDRALIVPLATRQQLRLAARTQKVGEIRGQIDAQVQAALNSRDDAARKVTSSEFKLQLAQTPAGYSPDGQLASLLDGVQSPQQLIEAYNGVLAGDPPNDAALYQIEQHAASKPELASNDLFLRLSAPVKAKRTQPQTDALTAAKTLHQASIETYLTAYFAQRNFEDTMKHMPVPTVV